MIFGDTCDSCQIAAAAASNADTNDPMAGQYQCSAAPPCGPGMATSTMTPAGSTTPAASNTGNASIWSTLTSAFTTAGQILPKTATAAPSSSSSLMLPLAVVGGGLILAVVLMGKKKRA